MTAIASTTARRQFNLPAEDVEWLEALGLAWETVIEGSVQWLFVVGWKLPVGFTSSAVTLGVRVVPSYPAGALDMVYVHPPLARIDGRGIPAVSECAVDGRTYQQWSRHYTATNPWRPDIDSVATHLLAADEWIRKAAA